MVSIIIPTYGLPIFLDKSIQSIISQTYTDWELIVVDDNNPETEERKQTKIILDKYIGEPRIKYIQHERNKNGAAARNTGLAVCNGNYVAFLDSDDIYMPTRIEKCVSILDANTKYDAVYTGCEFRKGGSKYAEFTNPQSGNHLVQTLATVFMLGTGSNLFLRRSTVVELKGFDENFIRHQDYEFMVRFFEKHDICSIPEILVIKNNENLNRPSPDKMLQIKRQYLSKYESVINGLKIEERNYIFYKHCVSLAEHYLFYGYIKEGSRFYRKALKYKKLEVRDLFRCLGFYTISLIKFKNEN